LKQTRNLEIEEKVFRIADLKRLSEIFDKQKQLAEKSDHHYQLEYSISFEDKTSFDSDSSSILDESSIIDTKRPLDVRFSFYNYTIGRRIDLRLTHGVSSYGNGLTVSGKESAWVNDQFMILKERIDAVKPQGSWFSKHPLVLVNLVALGIGSLGMLTINWLVNLMLPETSTTLSLSPETLEKLKHVVEHLSSYSAAFYMFGWFWRWLLGYMWGAYEVSKWFLKAWPSIELDFGAEHLKKEKQVRARLAALISLVVIPVLVTIGLDLIKNHL